jgi:hypothetical protein
MIGPSSASFSFGTSSLTATGSWSFIRQVTDSTGAEANSTVASVLVNVAPTVSITPASATLDFGQLKSFMANATGGSGTYLSYQWYVGSIAQVGQNASTFSYSPSSSSAPSVTVTVTDSLGATSVQSNSPIVTVNPILAASSVTASPGSVDQGQTSNLAVSAVTTGTSPYTYQWFEKAPGASFYSSINGATSVKYAFATSGSAALGTWLFKVRVTDSAGVAVNSTTAAVTVTSSILVPIAIAVSAAFVVAMGLLFYFKIHKR